MGSKDWLALIWSMEYNNASSTSIPRNEFTTEHWPSFPGKLTAINAPIVRFPGMKALRLRGPLRGGIGGGIGEDICGTMVRSVMNRDEAKSFVLSSIAKKCLQIVLRCLIYMKGTDKKKWCMNNGYYRYIREIIHSAKCFVGKMSVGKMSVGKMCVGKCGKMCVVKMCVVKMCVGKISVGKMCVGKISVGKMCVGKMSVGKMCVGKMCVGKMCVGKMSVGKMSIGKMSVGKMSVGKMSVDEMSVGKMHVRR